MDYGKDETCPEQNLWIGVIDELFRDIKRESKWSYCVASGRWKIGSSQPFRYATNGNEDFETVCEYAGTTPEYISRKLYEYYDKVCIEQKKENLMCHCAQCKNIKDRTMQPRATSF